MLNITDKADSTAGATGELTAAEYNDHKNEIQLAVTRSGQALSAGITDQFAKALFINGAAASSVSDSGSGDSIILSPLTGSPGLTVPNTYAELEGAILVFEKTTANTSTAVTVNFGQTGTELGAKSLVRLDGTVPAIGDVDGLCFIQWDNGSDKFVLLRNGSDTFKYPVSATGTVTPKFNKNYVISDTSGGSNTLTLADGEFFGQKVTIECDGTGLTYVKGTGVYLGASSLGTPVSDSLKGTWTWNGSAWVADNEITADYVSGDETITADSYGNMVSVFEIDLSLAISTATGGVFRSSGQAGPSFSAAFASIKDQRVVASSYGVGTANTTWSGVYGSQSLTALANFLIFSGTQVVTPLQDVKVYAKTKGKY